MRTNTRIRITFIAAIILGLYLPDLNHSLFGQTSIPSSSSTQPSQNGPFILSDASNTLIGVKGLYVRVTTDDASKALLSDMNFQMDIDTAQTDTELSLRKLGIVVMPMESAIYGLEISINVIRGPNGTFVFTTDASFNRPVYLDPNGRLMCPSLATWKHGVFGFASPRAFSDELAKAVRDVVDSFDNDYLKANPPRTAP